MVQWHGHAVRRISVPVVADMATSSAAYYTRAAHGGGRGGTVAGIPASRHRSRPARCAKTSTLAGARRTVYTGAVNERQRLGQIAEEAAARLLERAGLRVVERNVRLPGGEIDLVCRESARWVFVEVKCRQARWGDAPGAAVSWRKRRRIVRLAQHYLKWKGQPDAACRFDVVAVTVADDGAAEGRHLPAAFDASDLG